MRKFILWHYDLGRSNLLVRVSVCRRCRVGIDRYSVSITYSGPEIEGGCTQPEGPRWEGLFCSPTWPHPTPCRNQATSVSWLSACTQKPERRKQVSCFFFFFFSFTMWYTKERNKASPQSPLYCIKTGFYSCKVPKLVIGKMFCAPKIVLRSFCDIFPMRI